ncbi:hypothetical protein BGZ76_002342 [Entomortierella beljakovae]|nr:hypothetical protein BGZ76_002342 [Entomortierella beljakovae]
MSTSRIPTSRHVYNDENNILSRRMVLQQLQQQQLAQKRQASTIIPTKTSNMPAISSRVKIPSIPALSTRTKIPTTPAISSRGPTKITKQDPIASNKPYAKPVLSSRQILSDSRIHTENIKNASTKDSSIPTSKAPISCQTQVIQPKQSQYRTRQSARLELVAKQELSKKSKPIVTIPLPVPTQKPLPSSNSVPHPTPQVPIPPQTRVPSASSKKSHNVLGSAYTPGSSRYTTPKLESGSGIRKPTIARQGVTKNAALLTSAIAHIGANSSSSQQPQTSRRAAVNVQPSPPKKVPDAPKKPAASRHRPYMQANSEIKRPITPRKTTRARRPIIPAVPTFDQYDMETDMEGVVPSNSQPLIPDIDSDVFPEQDGYDLDPSLMSEYQAEIFAYKREMEIKLMADPDYMSRQCELTWRYRVQLIEWLTGLHDYFGFLQETLHLCVNYLDRFLSKAIIPADQLQLAGIVSLLLASKYEEVQTPSIESFVHCSGDAYSVARIRQAEIGVLRTLNYDMGAPGPMSFLRRISRADNYDVDIRTLAKYLIDVTLCDHRYVGVPSSMIAAIGYMASMRLLFRGGWTGEHESYSGYSERMLSAAVNVLLTLLEQPLASHGAIFKKYQGEIYMRSSDYVQQLGVHTLRVVKEEKRVKDVFENAKRRAQRRRAYYDSKYFICNRMPWASDPSVRIDRFDGRALLDYLPTATSAMIESGSRIDRDEDGIGNQLRFQRWHDLAEKSRLQISEEQCLGENEEEWNDLVARHQALIGKVSDRKNDGDDAQSAAAAQNFAFDYGTGVANKQDVKLADNEVSTLEEESILEHLDELTGADRDFLDALGAEYHIQNYYRQLRLAKQEHDARVLQLKVTAVNLERTLEGLKPLKTSDIEAMLNSRSQGKSNNQKSYRRRGRRGRSSSPAYHGARRSSPSYEPLNESSSRSGSESPVVENVEYIMEFHSNQTNDATELWTAQETPHQYNDIDSTAGNWRKDSVATGRQSRSIGINGSYNSTTNSTSNSNTYASTKLSLAEKLKQRMRAGLDSSIKDKMTTEAEVGVVVEVAVELVTKFIVGVKVRVEAAAEIAIESVEEVVSGAAVGVLVVVVVVVVVGIEAVVGVLVEIVKKVEVEVATGVTAEIEVDTNTGVNTVGKVAEIRAGIMLGAPVGATAKVPTGGIAGALEAFKKQLKGKIKISLPKE